ncbi:MAG: hypothetical protein COT26_01500 [Candidatus Kerfeldbacteria bacterium CG08_land_8_20_14_0_20_43_14]|uniref:Nudix hydrolase domain-containing protein n=1 Tax=Candidatus Kerfeldbacteria bacterium CG08_land_8_20_14_0_20_43_14 TaxID=2014246 RepID=A0A2H0YQP1_9BACT|nr:MAG: hypothetical protein COT26_01500 [Candidatus Kerfeldbacteria bacterium CG08_land_8_20_14_0_20_43_14]
MTLKLSVPNEIVLVYNVNGAINDVEPETMSVSTKYLDLEVQLTESTDGKIETWSTVTTRPAFEIAFLKKEDGQLYVVLMNKRRKATDLPLTKLPGGYLPDGGNTQVNMQEKVLRDTGISFEPLSLRYLGKVIGHPEIHTPIALYYTADWRKTGKPCPGVEIFEVPFETAVDLATDGEIENDSSFSVIMRLFVLNQKGMLIVHI